MADRFAGRAACLLAVLACLVAGAQADYAGDGVKAPAPPGKAQASAAERQAALEEEMKIASRLADLFRGTVKPPKPPAGKVTAEGLQYDWALPEWGTYKQRGSVLGIQIWAWDVVVQEAVTQTEKVLTKMLAVTSDDIKQRLVANKAKIAIAGRYQKLWDIPEHRFLLNDTGANWGSVRGAGGTLWNPTTTVGEENILELEMDAYKTENLLVHESGHMVMNIGMSQCQNQGIVNAFNAARSSGLYTLTAYCMWNEFEYFAVLTQGWFEAITRSDTNDALVTRYRILNRDAAAAAFLYAGFGAGPWRYPNSCPRCRALWPIIVPQPPPGFIPQTSSDRVCLPLVTPTLVSQVLITTRCDDLNSNCAAGAKAGLCTKPTSARYMLGTAGNGTYSLGKCLKSCGFCTAKMLLTTPCKDQNQYCASWASTGECKNNPNYMMSTCLTSCGYCNASPAPFNTAIPAPTGMETPNPADASPQPELPTGTGSSPDLSPDAASTPAAVPSPMPPPPPPVVPVPSPVEPVPSPAAGGCSDLNVNCPSWASTGQCTLNPGYMTGDPTSNFPGQCLLSCGSC